MKRTELTINLQETNGNGKIKLNLILIKGNDVLPDFFISDAPITQCTWNMLKDPKIEVEHSQFGIGEDYPMYFVNVQDCKDFISVLNGQLLTELQKASQTNYAIDKFELPTEEQWEFVAREGNARNNFTNRGILLHIHKRLFRYSAENLEIRKKCCCSALYKSCINTGFQNAFLEHRRRRTNSYGSSGSDNCYILFRKNFA